MKTMQGWRESQQDFDTYFTENCEVDKEVYYHFIGELPPIYIKDGYQVGEISFHRKGLAYHATFIEKDEQFFYVGQRPR